MYDQFKDVPELRNHMLMLCNNPVPIEKPIPIENPIPKNTLESDLAITYLSAPRFGYGENGDHYGGKKEIEFRIGTTKFCYENTLTHSSGFTNTLTINNEPTIWNEVIPLEAIWNEVIWLKSNIYDKNASDEIKTKNPYIYKFFAKLGKKYNKKAYEMIEFIGNVVYNKWY